jgi:hypothetical protein
MPGAAHWGGLTHGIGRVEGDFLVVIIKPWLAEELRISAGSLVIVDDRNGKFTITRSPANDAAIQ